MAFMGSCLAGAMASSHAFFILRVSSSAGVGGLRADTGAVLSFLSFCGVCQLCWQEFGRV